MLQLYTRLLQQLPHGLQGRVANVDGQDHRGAHLRGHSLSGQLERSYDNLVRRWVAAAELPGDGCAAAAGGVAVGAAEAGAEL